MAILGRLSRGNPPAHQHTGGVSEVQVALLTARTEAEIRQADADVDRDLRRRVAELDLAERQAAAAERARQRASAAAEEFAEVKRAKRKAKRDGKRDARRQWWAAFRARFQQALAGRLVLLLVACAVATAWHGQYGYLHDPAELHGQGLAAPFAVAGATALELLGLAMGAIVRAAGEYRDRAIRARLLMWGVIGFSGWSNLTHYGPVLAALSILGPTAWEVHEWWNRRAALHEAGRLPIRPVRPRFPIDQVLLFPLWTIAAYRVAVRDRIETTDRALEVARSERQQRRAFSRRSGRRWAAEVRAAIEANRALIGSSGVAAPASEGESIESSAPIGATGQPAALPIGSAGDQPGSADPIETGQAAPIGVTTVPTRPSRTRAARTRADRPESVTAPIDSTGTIPAGSGQPATRPIERDSIGDGDGDPIGSGWIEGGAGADSVDSIDTDTAGLARSGGPIRSAEETADRTRRTIGQLIRRSTTQAGSARGMSDEQLLREARELIKSNGWDPRTVTAETLRVGLKCAPKRARQLRDQIRQAAESAAITTTPADSAA